MIPEEQAPIELSEKVREYLHRMFSAARVEDTRKDRLVRLNNIPSKIAEGKVYYFDRAILPDILVAGAWMYIGGLWVQVSNNPEPVNAPTLINSWSNVGTPDEDAGYYKFADRVYIRGHLTGGASNTIAFVLPVGYRPARVVEFMCFTTSGGGGSGGNSSASVDASGNVRLYMSGTSTDVSLDSISFRV